MPDLTAAATRVSDLVRTTDDADLTRPTPCPDYTVADLIDHVGGLAVAFTAAATKSQGHGADSEPRPGDGSQLEPGWRERIAADLDALVVAWNRPDAATGMTMAGGLAFPGEVAGTIACNELVLHGWDLARALGRPFDVTEADLQACQGFLATFTDDDRGPAFGSPVPVPDDAALLDRVVGLGGRDPQWRPTDT